MSPNTPCTAVYLGLAQLPPAVALPDRHPKVPLSRPELQPLLEEVANQISPPLADATQAWAAWQQGALQLICAAVNHRAPSCGVHLPTHPPLLVIIRCPWIALYADRPVLLYPQLNALLARVYWCLARAVSMVLANEALAHTLDLNALLDSHVVLEGWCGYDAWAHVGTCFGWVGSRTFLDERPDAMPVTLLAQTIPEQMSVLAGSLLLNSTTQGQISAAATLENTTYGTALSFAHVALGGTFDHLHFGHKILLTLALWLASPRGDVMCGIIDMTPERLARKRDGAFMQDLQARTARLHAFAHWACQRTTLHVIPIQDDFGPTPHARHLDAIICSTETLPGCHAGRLHQLSV
jgi:phosphopantetheine adenylyltransferase